MVRISCLIFKIFLFQFIATYVAKAYGLSPTLGSFKISDITVSGISSGAYMAVQLHVSHSSIIDGVASFAGGPFYCAESTLSYATNKCMDISLGKPQTSKLISLTTNDAIFGYIDATKHLFNDHVYIFAGIKDSVVNPIVGRELVTYYQAFVNISNIVTEFGVVAEHCIPTLNYGEECSTLSSPYIGNCSFDGAGEVFKTFYGNNNIIKKGIAISSNLYSFDQRPFITTLYSSIGDTGYIYVPNSCNNNSSICHLHISFHGCHQNLEEINNTYAIHSGYNDWAETNNVIVLYPYVKPSVALPTNPNGCWDWWAYTNTYYGVKAGVQVAFIKRLIDALKGV